VIARAGVASRRDAEAMIAEGRITLNGETLASPAVNVGQDDRITVDGEPLPSRERTRLWLFHKPRGLVTTARDPQGRPTVFESLPEEMPRVVAIGRLDINTEGLLLLTNDGGLAKVVAHPETGWTRRYRARAHGEVAQADLDKLRKGVTVDEMEYGPIEASLDRVQGDNVWITLALKEGKNREVKRVLEHLGLQVNRLIRLSFGPFQLGDIEPGLVEEVRTRVLKDQLGQTLAQEAGVDFESPFASPSRLSAIRRPRHLRNAARRSARLGRARRASTTSAAAERPAGASTNARVARGPRRGPAPSRAPSGIRRRARTGRCRVARIPAARIRRRSGRPPRHGRANASAQSRHRKGRRVLVERLVSDPDSPKKPPRPRREDRAERPAPERAARFRRDEDDRPARPSRSRPGGFGGDREGRGSGRPGGAKPASGKPAGAPFRGESRGGPAFGGPRPGGRPGGKPGGRPGGPPRGRPR
jgi:23S rRNA pseudouridine2605 synthase